MAIAPELLAAGAEEGGAAASAVKSSGKMPRQPAYLTRKQAAQYTSDNAEYQDMKRREAGQGGGSARPRRSSSGGGGGGRRSPSAGRVASQTLRGVTRGGKTSIVTKLVFAAFAGLAALEIGSLATGRRFAIQIPHVGPSKLPGKPVYQSYYSGQPGPPNQNPTTTDPGFFGANNLSPGPITQGFINATAGTTTAGGTSVGSHPAQGINPTLYPTPASVSGIQWPSWLQVPTFRSPY